MTASDGRRRRRAWGAALAVAVIAVAFRLWRVETVPPGLYVDEVLTARNALAWRLAGDLDLLGTRPLLHAGWVETPNLYLAFVAGVLRLFGDGFTAIRMVSVLPSLAAVGLLYLLGREVAGRRVGWLAAFLLAASHWAARTGRTGWDQVLMVALHLAGLWLLARATGRGAAPREVPGAETTGAAERQAPQGSGLGPALGAGGVLGLALHTYVGARLAVLGALAWQGWEALAAWRSGRRARPAPGATAAATAGERPRPLRPAVVRLAGCALVVALLAAPIVWRELAHGPGTRLGQLAAWERSGPGEPWRTLGGSVLAHAGMFHLRGGAYARDALPGWPMLDPLSGLLLAAGVVVVVRRAGWQRRLLLTWPLFAVLGGVLSVSGEGPPYPYRVGSLPAWACLVAAIGALRLWDAVRTTRAATAAPRALGAVAAGGLATVVAVNGWVVFVAGPAYPGANAVYGTAPTQIGLWLRDHRRGAPTLVVADALAEIPVAGGFPHAAANRRSFYRPVDAAAALQLAAGVWARDPRRSLEPLRPAGDVDVVPALPASLPPVAVLVLPTRLAPAAVRRFGPAGVAPIVAPDGTPLAVAIAVLPPR